MRMKISNIHAGNSFYLEDDLGKAGLCQFGSYESDTAYITNSFNGVEIEKDKDLSLALCIDALLHSGFKIEFLDD